MEQRKENDRVSSRRLGIGKEPKRKRVRVEPSLESRGIIETRHALSIDLSRRKAESLSLSLSPFERKVRSKVYLTMPGDNLHRCYPPRRIGKSLLNDQRLGKLYSFLHFSTRYTFASSLLGEPCLPFPSFFPSAGYISQDPKSNEFSRFFSSFLSVSFNQRVDWIRIDSFFLI